MTQHVDSIQQGIERALQRTQSGDDKELAGRIREDGHRLVFLLNGMLRTTRLYAADNKAVAGPAEELSRLLQGLLDLLGAVHVVLVEDQVYVNDVRLRIRPGEQPIVDGLMAELARHEVGGLSIHSAVSPDDVKRLATALAAAPADQKPRQALVAQLASLPAVELTGRYRFRLEGDAAPTEASQAASLQRGRKAVAEALANLAAGRLPNPLPVRRAVMDIVDAFRDAPERAPAAAAFVAASGPERHALAVGQLALMLGRALGLPDAVLSDLGVAALLHDVGYGQRHDLMGHARAGARTLLRQRGFHEAKVRRVLTAAEHHLPWDDLGQRPTLFARIVRIADDYEVLVTAPSPGPPLPPATAVGVVWAGRGRAYDPHLVGLFVRCMGAFPPGTLLELSDGRQVVTVSGARSRETFHFPLARILRDASGPRDATEEIDLAAIRASVVPRKLLEPSAAPPGWRHRVVQALQAPR